MTNVAIIPARANDFVQHLVLRTLAGKPLLLYTIEAAKSSQVFSKILVVTEDAKIAELAKFSGAEVILQPPHLSAKGVPIEDVAKFALLQMEKDSHVPEVIAILFPNSPFKHPAKIAEAVQKLRETKADFVVPVFERKKHFYVKDPGEGLKPLFAKRLTRTEGESIYEENGTMFVAFTTSLDRENLQHKKIEPVLMSFEESLNIDSEFDFWLAEKIALERLKQTKAQST
ncbi:MAG TPA: acylneuraminate cytidylyltransferase family protein [Candidatus Nanoarchaeia archaeon]|nr:acylneuraminate cytidylyltransferase family protein [Candidatus Nanoarchaeia archaeon]